MPSPPLPGRTAGMRSAQRTAAPCASGEWLPRQCRPAWPGRMLAGDDCAARPGTSPRSALSAHDLVSTARHSRRTPRSRDQGGSAALRRTAPPAPRSGLRPRAHGRASWEQSSQVSGLAHPRFPNSPASTGTRRERSASPAAMACGHSRLNPAESRRPLQLSRMTPGQVKSGWLSAASSRLQRSRSKVAEDSEHAAVVGV